MQLMLSSSRYLYFTRPIFLYCVSNVGRNVYNHRLDLSHYKYEAAIVKKIGTNYKLYKQREEGWLETSRLSSKKYFRSNNIISKEIVQHVHQSRLLYLVLVCTTLENLSTMQISHQKIQSQQ